MAGKERNQKKTKETGRKREAEGDMDAQGRMPNRSGSEVNRGLGSQDDDLQQRVASGGQPGTFLREEQADTPGNDLDEDLQREADENQKRHKKTNATDNESSGRYGTAEGSPSGRSGSSSGTRK